VRDWVLAIGIAMMLASCRSDIPPKLSTVCVLDGLGGGDCIEADGSKKYMAPSEMENFWATTQTDEANFAAWCYNVPKEVVESKMKEMRDAIPSSGSP